MGGRASTPAVTPYSSEESVKPLICDLCINLDKPAKGWCGQCAVFLCQLCVNTHRRSPKVATGRQMPQSRPDPESLSNNVIIKQVISVTTLEDFDAKENAQLTQAERNIRGCVSVDNFVVTITYQRMTLYDAEFKYIGQLDFVESTPNSICCQGMKIVVSFEYSDGKIPDGTETPQSIEPLVRNFHDIQVFTLKLPGCFAAKLSRTRGIKTEGTCFSVATLPVYDKELIIAAGMKLDEERNFVMYQVQILKSNGKVLHTLGINPRGEPNFNGKFFISGTMKFGEIVVSEVKEKRVRGVDLNTGKTLYEFEGGNPQGLAMDKDDNIYVLNDSAMYWIPPLRNKIHYMMQEYVKKKGPREKRLANSIHFTDESRLLFVTCMDKDTIETYRIV